MAFGLTLAGGPVQAELLAPTPLILKDGRIASVSVHVLPFTTGQATIGATAGRSLMNLTREVATDCFLTAQVIGHVGSDEVRNSDTLTAHRLARSRADAVQASLIGTGLPAKSIASVWDWQFMVLEPRATLWVFELTKGEDCEGTPLDGVAVPVAAVEPGPTASADPDDRQPDPPAGQTGPFGPSGAATTASEPTALATPAAASPGSGSAARAPVEPRPAVAPPAASAPATARAPATEPAIRTRPTRQVARATPDAASTGGDVERSLSIVFATNSSYFPAGTREQLEALVDALESGGRYRVELVASVSDASSVVGAANPDEAARYNQWLANRRLDRVQSWLKVNAKDKDLIIQPEFQAKDDSRRVLVRISPAKTS